MMQPEKIINLSEVVYRNDLYPRISTDAATVQKYAEDIDVLPPIEVNQFNELIDGWHRWTAHKKVNADTIRVIVTETKSDMHLLELAIERNATHGLQLSQEDKREMALRIYQITPVCEHDRKKKELARLLSVSDKTIHRWLANIDRDTKEARNRRVSDLWMACRTQEEIAEIVGCPRETVRDLIVGYGDYGHLSVFAKAAADHAVDFDPPIYDIWCKYGNNEIRWTDNLLYYYTQPFDVVVDPFAGSGSTIDICKKRFRRYWVSDRLPIVEWEKEIRQWDVTDGLPPLSRWQDVKLVYLNPPWWKREEGKYSKDPTDLANMSLEDFHKTLSNLINGIAKKLSDGAYIALIISPTSWQEPGKLELRFEDPLFSVLSAVKLSTEIRLVVPHNADIYDSQQVEWALANKQMWSIGREINVWKVDKNNKKEVAVT